MQEVKKEFESLLEVLDVIINKVIKNGPFAPPEEGVNSITIRGKKIEFSRLPGSFLIPALANGIKQQLLSLESIGAFEMKIEKSKDPKFLSENPTDEEINFFLDDFIERLGKRLGD